MEKTKVAIIGLGYVGRAYQKLFPDAVVYDPFKGFDDKTSVNSCNLAIVSVPTAMKEDGSCDTSIVEETVEWVETPLILIKSTIPPGTTARLKKETSKRICHSPEYVGEGGYFIPFWEYPHPTEPLYHSFMIIGGDPQDREDILQHFYPVLDPAKTYYQVNETTSELIKYFENCTIATKVTLCNEFYEMAKAFGVNYSQVREGLILDKRLGEMFTLVFRDKRGFGGKCLPKDVNAIIKATQKMGYNPEFLEEVLISNERFREKNEGK